MQERRKFAEAAILPGSRLSIYHQHPRCRTIGERLLRDQLFWKMVVEIGK